MPGLSCLPLQSLAFDAPDVSGARQGCAGGAALERTGAGNKWELAMGPTQCQELGIFCFWQCSGWTHSGAEATAANEGHASGWYVCVGHTNIAHDMVRVANHVFKKFSTCYDTLRPLHPWVCSRCLQELPQPVPAHMSIRRYMKELGSFSADGLIKQWR